MTSVNVGLFLFQQTSLAAGQTGGSAQVTINGTTVTPTFTGDGSLTLSGTLDLLQKPIFINYGADPDPIATVQSLIVNAYNHGVWNGAGITSSFVRANALMYGVGYADRTDPGNPAGLNPTTLEARPTLLGDTQLRGTVGGVDYNTVVANFDTAQAWSGGDFNYDGQVSGSDYNNVIANFDSSAVTPALATSAVIRAARQPSALKPLINAITSAASSAPAVTDFRLEVNTKTGDVQLLATAAATLTLYNIQDTSKNLVTANLITLGSRYPGFTAISKKTGAIAEGQDNSVYDSANPSTFDTIAFTAGREIDLGNIFGTLSNIQDLSFEFAEANSTTGNPVTGPDFTYAGVDYIAAPEPESTGILLLAGIAWIEQRRTRRSRFPVGGEQA